jgi:pyruvate-formate lyase-activating enzyme
MKRTHRVDLKVGFDCNNRCVFCVQGDKREWLSARPRAELEAILERRSGTAHALVLTGGEPTMRGDLVEIVAYARSLGYTDIQLQTNGRRLSYRSYVEALVEAGVTEIAPSLHGSRADLHDRLTRAPRSFAQTVRGIRVCRDLGLRVVTNSVVVRDNLVDLSNLARLLVQLGVYQAQLAFVHPAGTALQLFDHVVPRFTEAMPWVEAALLTLERGGVRAATEAIPFCFMRGLERFVAERWIPETSVEDATVVHDDYTKYRREAGKARGPQCAACTFDAVCEGPWREYPDGHGWGEFRPRKDAVPTWLTGGQGAAR